MSLSGNKCRGGIFDLTTAINYWGKERLINHTPADVIDYGFARGDAHVIEAGLEARWERHRVNQLALNRGRRAWDCGCC